MNHLSVRKLLEARALLLQQVRAFFVQEGLLEVETPLLVKNTTTDPYITPVKASLFNQNYYLQSSPEFSMKHLLGSGSGSIFQICKAFRDEEQGSRHRSEFTMLEWYVLDFTYQQLLDQTIRLLSILVNFDKVVELSYAECFENYLDINIFEIPLEKLRLRLTELIEVENITGFSQGECLNLLFAECIETKFQPENLTIVYDFPESQAALAKLGKNPSGFVVAKRFEIYLSGLELANAYEEESSETVLRKRFEKDNQIRASLKRELIPLDEKFLWLMKNNFPSCSGIALGIDRLLMIQLNKSDIAKVLPLA